MSEPDQSKPPHEVDDPREEKRVDVPPDVTPVVTPGPTGQPAEGTVTPAEVVPPVPTVPEGPQVVGDSAGV